MPIVHTGGLRHYYRIDGNDDRPVLMFAHSLGCDHSQWDTQTADLQPHFRVLRYDIRGHGLSDAPAGDYSIEALAGDALAMGERPPAGGNAAIRCSSFMDRPRSTAVGDCH